MQAHDGARVRESILLSIPFVEAGVEGWGVAWFRLVKTPQISRKQIGPRCVFQAWWGLHSCSRSQQAGGTSNFHQSSQVHLVRTSQFAPSETICNPSALLSRSLPKIPLAAIKHDPLIRVASRCSAVFRNGRTQSYGRFQTSI